MANSAGIARLLVDRLFFPLRRRCASNPSDPRAPSPDVFFLHSNPKSTPTNFRTTCTTLHGSHAAHLSIGRSRDRFGNCLRRSKFNLASTVARRARGKTRVVRVRVGSSLSFCVAYVSHRHGKPTPFREEISWHRVTIRRGPTYERRLNRRESGTRFLGPTTPRHFPRRPAEFSSVGATLSGAYSRPCSSPTRSTARYAPRRSQRVCFSILTDSWETSRSNFGIFHRNRGLWLKECHSLRSRSFRRPHCFVSSFKLRCFDFQMSFEEIQKIMVRKLFVYEFRLILVRRVGHSKERCLILKFV